MTEEVQDAEMATPAVTITLTDIDNMVKVIDTVTARGAFRGEEMSSVGTLRDRFVAFLKAATPPPTQTEEESVEETPETA